MKPKFTISFLIGLLCCFTQLNAQVLPGGQTCSDAIELNCGDVVSGSTVNVANDNATSGAGQCITSVGTAGQIWYTITATNDDLISVSTCGGGFDTKIHVYAGSCGNLSCISGNDDACSLQSTVSFAGVTGVTYFVRVGGFSGNSGDFTLTTTCSVNQGGCTNASASNYDPEATFDDGSCAYEGCTDPSALNYNGVANVDDGSCVYCDGEGSTIAQMYVCTFSNGGDVALTVTDANGNVVIDVAGLGSGSIAYFDLCLLPGNCYNVVMSNANGGLGWSNGYFWINANGVQVINQSLNADLSVEYSFFSIDGTCNPILGCTDSAAINYNPDANADDGSCLYPPTCETGTIATLNFFSGSFASECSFEILDAAGNTVYSSGTNSVNGSFTGFMCAEVGCYTVIMHDSFGDGWNGGYLTIYAGGSATTLTCEQGTIAYGAFGINSGECSPNIVSGCTNSAASNYNPAAVIDDGSCLVEGCTDPGALNYNWTATVDNGSCEYCNGEGSVIAALYICTYGNGNQVELQIVDDQGNEVYYASGLNSGSIVNAQVCLLPGVCYTANMINNAGPFGWYGGYFWVNAAGFQVINTQPSATGQFESVQFSIDGTCGPVYGCTDPTALNYNPEANANDGSCFYPIYGCTDPLALNFNQGATADDGSCFYPSDCASNSAMFVFYPGTFVNEGSYSIVDANGTVVASGSGATSSYACLEDGCYTINMYDTFGDGWDNSGYLDVYVNGVQIGIFTLASSQGTFGTAGFGINAEGCVPVVAGCTDPSALNYNPAATEDDGSCQYPASCDANMVYITIITQAWGSEMSWSLVGADGTVYASGSGYNSWSYYSTFVCVPDGCYELVMNDAWGDGWNGGYYSISAVNSYYEGSVYYGSTATDMIGVNSACGEVAGCTDSTATNYNPAATFDDGSCTYNNDGFTGVGLGLEVEFNLYPNPANSGIVVNLNNLNSLEGIQLNVMSMDGKVVNSTFYPNGESSKAINMNVSELAAGYYFVQMINGDNVKVLPLIKE